MIRQGLYILFSTTRHPSIALLSARSNGRAPTQEHSAVAGPPYLEELHSAPHTRPSQTSKLAQRGSRNPRLYRRPSTLSGALSFSYVRVLTKSLAMNFGAAARDRSIRQWDSYRHATSWAYPSPLPHCRCHDTIDRLQMMDKYRMPIFLMPS
jgi:hypothetical protein